MIYSYNKQKNIYFTNYIIHDTFIFVKDGRFSEILSKYIDLPVVLCYNVCIFISKEEYLW